MFNFDLLEHDYYCLLSGANSLKHPKRLYRSLVSSCSRHK